jgi:hypothetical protein
MTRGSESSGQQYGELHGIAAFYLVMLAVQPLRTFLRCRSITDLPELPNIQGKKLDYVLITSYIG